ncbi:MAG: hypothetical protein KPI85_01130 [cyanobacterium endosymbiont of Epithemia adnata isolate EadnSB Bon19]|jgi:hypothetical protein
MYNPTKFSNLIGKIAALPWKLVRKLNSLFRALLKLYVFSLLPSLTYADMVENLKWFCWMKPVFFYNVVQTLVKELQKD